MTKKGDKKERDEKKKPKKEDKKEENKKDEKPTKEKPVEETIPKLCDKVKEIDSLNLIIDEQKKTIDKIKKEFNDYKNYAENKFKELEALIKKESENLNEESSSNSNSDDENEKK